MISASPVAKPTTKQGLSKMRKLTAVAVALGFLAVTSLPTLAAPAANTGIVKTDTFSAKEKAKKAKKATKKEKKSQLNTTTFSASEKAKKDSKKKATKKDKKSQLNTTTFSASEKAKKSSKKKSSKKKTEKKM